MAMLSLKVITSLLQLHGPDATIQSDHPGIDALLGDVRGQLSRDGADVIAPEYPEVRQVYFRRFAAPGFRRGGFRRI
jgi:hypothetical protein